MLTGIDKVVYGVEDLAECMRFFRDWGLAPVGEGDGRATFETLDGAEVSCAPSRTPRSRRLRGGLDLAASRLGSGASAAP